MRLTYKLKTIIFFGGWWGIYGKKACFRNIAWSLVNIYQSNLTSFLNQFNFQVSRGLLP